MITGHVTGDASMLLYLKSRGIAVRDELRTAVKTQGIRMLRLVKLKVSGPVLKNRSGTLRRKVNVLFAESETEITASVGLQLSYAAAHEYGFDGTVTIREHLRTITQAFGRKLAAPVTFPVPAHAVRMKIPERSYLRSTLREEGESIRVALGKAVQQAFA
jgi:phage gpG-like protein